MKMTIDESYKNGEERLLSALFPKRPEDSRIVVDDSKPQIVAQISADLSEMVRAYGKHRLVSEQGFTGGFVNPDIDDLTRPRYKETHDPTRRETVEKFGLEEPLKTEAVIYKDKKGKIIFYCKKEKEFPRTQYPFISQLSKILEKRDPTVVEQNALNILDKIKDINRTSRSYLLPVYISTDPEEQGNILGFDKANISEDKKYIEAFLRLTLDPFNKDYLYKIASTQIMPAEVIDIDEDMLEPVDEDTVLEQDDEVNQELTALIAENYHNGEDLFGLYDQAEKILEDSVELCNLLRNPL